MSPLADERIAARVASRRHPKGSSRIQRWRPKTGEVDDGGPNPLFSDLGIEVRQPGGPFFDGDSGHSRTLKLLSGDHYAEHRQAVIVWRRPGGLLLGPNLCGIRSAAAR
jgi:hypothetical protein